MPCNEMLKDGGRGLLLTATRDCKAVQRTIQQCAAVKVKDLPCPIADAEKAVKDAAGQIAGDPPNIDYDSVDDYIEGCGTAAQLILGRFPCWQNSDVMLRLHFGRQTFRYSGRKKDAKFTLRLRRSDAWQTTRLGLAIYFDLLRIGMTGKRKSDMTSLAGAIGGPEAVAFNAVAVGGTSDDTVVPAGLGPLQKLVKGIEDAYKTMRDVRAKMTERLPQPESVKPRHEDAWLRRACFTCVPVSGSA